MITTDFLPANVNKKTYPNEGQIDPLIRISHALNDRTLSIID